jgi:hypothetical protein
MQLSSTNGSWPSCSNTTMQQQLQLLLLLLRQDLHHSTMCNQLLG